MGALFPHDLQKQHGRRADDGHEHDAGDDDMPVQTVGKEGGAVRHDHRRGGLEVKAADRTGNDGQCPDGEHRQQKAPFPPGESVHEKVKEQFHAEQGHQRHLVPEIHARPHLQPHEDGASGPQDGVQQHRQKRPDLRGLFRGQERDEHQQKAAEDRDVDKEKGNVVHSTGLPSVRPSACWRRRPTMSSIPGLIRGRCSPIFCS